MSKRPIVLIICIIIVFIALLLFIYLFRGGSINFTDINSKEDENISDFLEFTLDASPLEKTNGDVDINIIAKSSEENEIISITLPDGKTTGYKSDMIYSVNENGDYSFTIMANNGKTITKTITINNIISNSYDNPYIPEGFKHIDNTEVNTGFVIEDKNGNQYVWVPVKNGVTTRTAPSEKYFEDDYTSSALNNSIAKYYGFYIAKYEASRDNVNGIIVAKSVGGVIPWSNVKYDEAYNAARNTAISYNYINVKTALINSYAWDSTLNWLNTNVENYSSSRNYGNYSNQILNTGETKKDIVNQISDISGNLREWTTERYDENRQNNDDENIISENISNTVENSNINIYRVVRGGSATMDKIANSRIGERTDLQDNYWGFRIILYKE